MNEFQLNLVIFGFGILVGMLLNSLANYLGRRDKMRKRQGSIHDAFVARTINKGYTAMLKNQETKCWMVTHYNPDPHHAELHAEVWGADNEEEAIELAVIRGSWG